MKKFYMTFASFFLFDLMLRFYIYTTIPEGDSKSIFGKVLRLNHNRVNSDYSLEFDVIYAFSMILHITIFLIMVTKIKSEDLVVKKFYSLSIVLYVSGTVAVLASNFFSAPLFNTITVFNSLTFDFSYLLALSGFIMIRFNATFFDKAVSKSSKINYAEIDSFYISRKVRYNESKFREIIGVKY